MLYSRFLFLVLSGLDESVAMLLAGKKLMLYATRRSKSQQLVRMVTSIKDLLSFLERPTVEVFFHYMQPGEMIFQPSNFANVCLTLSEGRSAIAGWDGCDRSEPRRVTDCLKQYPSPLSVETICGVHASSRDKLSFSTTLLQMSESKRKPEDPQMELTKHVERLCIHFDIFEKFALPRTVGPRRTPRTVAAERTSHFIDAPTQWFLDGCPGEVENITPRFQSQMSSQKWPNLVVKV